MPTQKPGNYTDRFDPGWRRIAKKVTNRNVGGDSQVFDLTRYKNYTDSAVGLVPAEKQGEERGKWGKKGPETGQAGLVI